MSRAAVRRPIVQAKDRLRAKSIALLEECSLRTAQRLMSSGKLGAVRGRSRRDRWVSRQNYEAYLATL